jgi:DNA damage-binding protein 1
VEEQPGNFFLGDLHGNLHILQAQSEDDRIVRLTLLECGHISSPRALVALSQAHLYVGSHYGDSQLLKLSFPSTERHREETPMDIDEDDLPSSQRPQPTETAPSLEIVSTYTNLAPIVDFAVVENEHQSHIVTCSGSYNDGSLRIVSHGVGLTELASLDLENVQKVWAVKSGQFRCVACLSFSLG